MPVWGKSEVLFQRPFNIKDIKYTCIRREEDNFVNSGCCFSGASVILDRSCHNALRKRNFLNNWSKTLFHCFIENTCCSQTYCGILLALGTRKRVVRLSSKLLCLKAAAKSCIFLFMSSFMFLSYSHFWIIPMDYKGFAVALLLELDRSTWYWWSLLPFWTGSGYPPLMAMFWGAGRLVNTARHDKKGGKPCCNNSTVKEFASLVLV